MNMMFGLAEAAVANASSARIDGCKGSHPVSKPTARRSDNFSFMNGVNEWERDPSLIRC